MKQIITFASLLSVLGLTGCSTHMISLKYEPIGTAIRTTEPPKIASSSFSDDRRTDSNWLGAIRGGYGNPLKKLRTASSTSDEVDAVFSTALRSRNMLGTPETSNKAIEARITKFDCSYCFNREAHAHIDVNVITLPERTTVFSRQYKTDNVESGVGAGIFGDVNHLAKFAQKTLCETIEKILDDPDFLAALASSAPPPSHISPADRLRQLEKLHTDKLISDSEFETKRKKIIDEL